MWILGFRIKAFHNLEFSVSLSVNCEGTIHSLREATTEKPPLSKDKINPAYKGSIAWTEKLAAARISPQRSQLTPFLNSSFCPRLQNFGHPAKLGMEIELEL